MLSFERMYEFVSKGSLHINHINAGINSLLAARSEQAKSTTGSYSVRTDSLVLAVQKKFGFRGRRFDVLSLRLSGESCKVFYPKLL